MSPPIVIAGGGIGGLTAAIALRRRGLDAVVLERAPELGAVGAGITVQTNAMVVMQALGLREQLVEEGHEILSGELRTSDGTVLQRLDLAEALRDVGPLGVAIHRQRLQRVLCDAYEGPLRLGTPVVGYSATDDEVIVHVEGGEDVTGEALVGCDGLHSDVRRTMRGEEELRYAGYTTWRGIARGLADEIDGTTEIYGAGDRFGIVPIGHGEVYWFAVADAPAGGADGDDVLGELAERFTGWPDPVERLLDATVDVLRTDTLDRPPIDDWGEGRVTLLGDAAHPMTPNLGQGAGQAIEDAWALAAALDEHRDDVVAGLRAYEGARRARANDFVVRSYRLGQMAQLRNPLARILRDHALSWTPEAMAVSGMRKMYTPSPDPRAEPRTDG